MSECGSAPQSGEPVYHMQFLLLCTHRGEAGGGPRKPASRTTQDVFMVHNVNFKAALGEDTGASHTHPGYSLKNLG